MRVRKNDTVVVLAGKDRGKRGRVRKALPDKESVVVEGLNMIKRHSRTRRSARQAGIIELESPIHISNVQLVCNKCGEPTRVGAQNLEDGRKVRVCRSCGEVMD